MARTPKKGLDYADWSVRIFEDDDSIDTLIDAQGWIGFSIYFYLCQKAYATNGYYLNWDDNSAVRTARKMGGGVTSESVRQTVALCSKVGLFSDRLLAGESILTSRGIQKRYMNAVEKRADSGRTINPKYWLLKKCETKAFIIMPENTDNLSENNNNLPENATEYSRVEKSREDESREEKILVERNVIISKWNMLSSEYGIIKITQKDLDIHKDKLQKLLSVKGLNELLICIDKIKESRFLLGQTTNFVLTFKFFIEHFEKIYNGGYKDFIKHKKNAGYEQRQYTEEELKQAFERRAD